jgi:hypothetical protein
LADLFAALEATQIASHLRVSRWTYPLVNAGHVLGIALLIGAVAPLDLRLIGLWRHIPLASVAAVVRPVAATGLVLALATGALLFATGATEYAAMQLFWFKLALVAAALVNVAFHGGPGILTAPPLQQRLAGAASLGLWIGVLLCGRMLGYL